MTIYSYSIKNDSIKFSFKENDDNTVGFTYDKKFLGDYKLENILCAYDEDCCND